MINFFLIHEGPPRLDILIEVFPPSDSPALKSAVEAYDDNIGPFSFYDNKGKEITAWVEKPLSLKEKYPFLKLKLMIPEESVGLSTKWHKSVAYYYWRTKKGIIFYWTN